MHCFFEQPALTTKTLPRHEKVTKGYFCRQIWSLSKKTAGHQQSCCSFAVPVEKYERQSWFEKILSADKKMHQICRTWFSRGQKRPYVRKLCTGMCYVEEKKPEILPFGRKWVIQCEKHFWAAFSNSARFQGVLAQGHGPLFRKSMSHIESGFGIWL